MPSNLKSSRKKIVGPRSSKRNDQATRKTISKRQRKPAKHRTVTDASIEVDSLRNIESQNSCTTNIGIEESNVQPNESAGQDNSKADDVTMRAQINSTDNGSLLVFSATIESSQSQARYNIRKPMKIAVSYAGKTKDRVEIISQSIHDILTTPQSPFPVFYAPNFQGQLSGYNATDTLLDIYDNASLVVVFLSSAYTKSSFCQDEWRRIRERFAHGKGRTQRRRLIFIKLNEFNPKKLNLTRDDFFIDGLKYDDQQIANMIIERWNEVGKLPSRSRAKPE